MVLIIAIVYIYQVPFLVVFFFKLLKQAFEEGKKGKQESQIHSGTSLICPLSVGETYVSVDVPDSHI